MDRTLPIYEVESHIIDGIRQHNRLIINAPTGSGKSTQVPQIIFDNGLNGKGVILILQPRRIAARLLSRRVARELDSKLGDLVGYQIRFEDVSTENTKIKFITEGILLRRILSDSNLEDVSVLIFDEFHERHLYTDVSLAMALDLQKNARPDLKIIVMSATLELDSLEKYLSPCEVIKSGGKTYPVRIDYYEPGQTSSSTIWKDVVKTFVHFRETYNSHGDVLIFLPGAYEIRKTVEELSSHHAAKDYLIFPLYGELPLDLQEAAIRQYDKKKIVVATNIAETSITINGITTVIDTGLAKIPMTDPITGITSLKMTRISRASADQRAGRAGRTAPGVCIRMWQESEHELLKEFEIPEIHRLELSEIVLLFKVAGKKDLYQFKWLDAPGDESVFAAERLLKELGALDEQGHITDIGKQMAKFPVHPRYSRMLIEARRYDCVYHIALIASIIQTGDLIYTVSDTHYKKIQKDLFCGREDSDFFMQIKAFEYALENGFEYIKCNSVGIKPNLAYQIYIAHKQFLRIAENEGFNVENRKLNKEAIQKCILVGFSDLVGKRINISDNSAEIVHGRRGQISYDTVVKDPDLFVTAEIFETEKHGCNILIFYNITRIKEEWLREFFPKDVKKQEPRVFYDQQTRTVIEEETALYRDLVLKRTQKVAPPSDKTSKILAEKVLQGELILKEWDSTIDKWILRVNLLNEACPELGIPYIGKEEKLTILEQICFGASTYKDIKDRPVKHIAYSFLNEHQREMVDKFAPERLALSNGKTPKIVYVEKGSPYISMRIQELYGVDSIPKIAMGKVEVLVHILAPNMQPVQVTGDLKGFWERCYPEIKKQYQRLYPKHEWR